MFCRFQFRVQSSDAFEPRMSVRIPTLLLLPFIFPEHILRTNFSTAKCTQPILNITFKHKYCFLFPNISQYSAFIIFISTMFHLPESQLSNFQPKKVSFIKLELIASKCSKANPNNSTLHYLKQRSSTAFKNDPSRASYELNSLLAGFFHSSSWEHEHENDCKERGVFLCLL